MNILELDQFMRLRPTPKEGVRWFAPFEAPLALEGFAFFSADGVYRRLPLDMEPVLSAAGREPLNQLSRQTAGGCVRFTSDTGCVSIKVRLTAPCRMYHMPAAGQGGFDCYLRRPGGPWRYGGTARFDPSISTYNSLLWGGGDRRKKEFLIHFPLYMGVEEVWIGLEEDASVAPPLPRAHTGAIAIYGTSIDQGGCASHPGMAFPAILARQLDVSIYNLGFSGNGCLEPELAEVIARIPGLRLAVIDAEANAGPMGALYRLPDFLSRLRQSRPEVPLLVISAPDGPLEARKPELVQKKAVWRQEQRQAVEALGDPMAAFLDGRQLWPDGGEDYTVDGVHPSDLGFYQIARNLAPILERYL